MAVINDPSTVANVTQVGPVSTLTTQNPLHTLNYPIPFFAGHYRVFSRFTLAAAQVAAARVWEFRNGHISNFMVVTRFNIRVVQSNAGTAQNNGLDVFRNTAFTVVDNVNTVTPTSIPKRTAFTAAPAGAVIRHVTVAGAAAGMTGGTRTPDLGPFFALPLNVSATPSSFPASYEIADDVNGTHPLVLNPSEGIEIQNRVLNVTSYGIDVYVDFCWAEVLVF